MSTFAIPLASTIGIVCTLTGMVPQVVRTVRSRRTDGLAPTGLWLSIILNVVWVGYSFAAWDVAMLGMNTVTTLLAIVVLLSYRRHAPAPVPWWLNLAGAAALTTVIALTAAGQTMVLSVTAAVLGFVVGLPQLVALVRKSGTDGVAAGTYLIGIVGAVAWTVRWGLIGNPAVTLSSLYSVLVNVTGLVLLRYRPAIAQVFRTMRGWAARPVTEQG